MAYTKEVLSRAREKLKLAQKTHEQEQEALRREIYARVPRTAEIGRELRATAPRILAASLRQGLGQQEALEAVQKQNQALQAEEAALLSGAGYSPDALVPKPLCSLCGDTGWRGTEMCVCLREFCRQEQIRSLSSMLDMEGQSFSSFRLDYYDSNWWPELNRSPRQQMELVFNFCRRYAEQFGSGTPPKNLFLSGSPGLGKTFLSACIARRVSERGFSVVYDTAVNIFSRFESRQFFRGEEETRRAAEDTHRYLECDLLILDDLGSEFTASLVNASLYEIINSRLITGKQTVISSNLNLADIIKRYSPQIASRLNGEYSALLFYGQDIRNVKKQV